MGLEISKRYSAYSFSVYSFLMAVKLYEDIGYHRGIKAIAFLGHEPKF